MSTDEAGIWGATGLLVIAVVLALGMAMRPSLPARTQRRMLAVMWSVMALAVALCACVAVTSPAGLWGLRG